MNAILPFGTAGRFRAAQVIEAGAGVGIDDPESRRLVAQMHQDAGEHRMLDDVGGTTGVKGVAIIHG
jgi:hypothetical protein